MFKGWGCVWRVSWFVVTISGRDEVIPRFRMDQQYFEHTVAEYDTTSVALVR